MLTGTAAAARVLGTGGGAGVRVVVVGAGTGAVPVVGAGVAVVVGADVVEVGGGLAARPVVEVGVAPSRPSSGMTRTVVVGLRRVPARRLARALLALALAFAAAVFVTVFAAADAVGSVAMPVNVTSAEAVRAANSLRRVVGAVGGVARPGTAGILGRAGTLTTVGAVAASLVNITPRTLAPGVMVGPLAYGCWRFVDPDVRAAREIIEGALAAGMGLIDTADIYGYRPDGTSFGASEGILGTVLKEAPQLREQIVLATKGGIWPGVPYDSSDTYLRSALDASRRRLGVDVVDLYQIHRADLYVHPRMLAATLVSMVESGAVRLVGVSNFTVAQTQALAAELPFPLATIQPEFSPTTLTPMRDGTLDWAIHHDVLPLAWSPLAGGALGDDAPASTRASAALLDVLDALAGREGVGRSAIALAFVLAHPSRPVAIIGTQRPHRIAAATQALSVRLDRSDCYSIIQASEGLPLP